MSAWALALYGAAAAPPGCQEASRDASACARMPRTLLIHPAHPARIRCGARCSLSRFPLIPLAVTDQRAATTTPRDARPVDEREAGDLRNAPGRNGLRRAVESGRDVG